MPKSSEHVLSTDRQVQSARPIGERAEFRIAGAKNLVLRITRNGAKSWHFLYASPFSGQRRKLALGTYPETSLSAARDKALALTVAVRAGRDPLAEREVENATDTFRDLADSYLREHAQKFAVEGRSGAWTKEVCRLLHADVLPILGNHKTNKVTKHQVKQAVEAVADRGSYVTADRVLGLIRSIYTWAGATGRSEVDPTFGLRKRNTGRPRERVLSDQEIGTLWLHLDAPSHLSHQIRDALKLQLLLGVRIGEALGALTGEIDLDRRIWTIPAIRTKAFREHRLPLCPSAVDILRNALDRAGTSTWLFPARNYSGPVRSKSAQRAMLRLGKKLGIADIGTHDLRRTLATGLGDMNVADETIERILNHAPRTVAGKHYNHAKHFEPMRRALDAWSLRVQAIIESAEYPSNIVTFPISGRG